MVACSRRERDSLTQLYAPQRMTVNQVGIVYEVVRENHRGLIRGWV